MVGGKKKLESDFSQRPAFETIRPRRQLAPLVFNSAHSGDDYPVRFLGLTRLDRLSIRQSEDTYVDEIFSRTPHMGALMLRARFPRAYLDVNREPFELDQTMFCEPLPTHFNTNSPRVAAGLGTLARIVAENKSIYREQLTLGDALMRIDGIYRPYHATLQKLLSESVNRFGCAVLIDCHSMPRLAKFRHRVAPDIVLGDRFGSTCAPLLVDVAEEVFHDAGLRVARNRPYAGGFVTRSYGKPQFGIHALQIEISRHLYMNEATRVAHDGLEDMKQVVNRLTRALMHLDVRTLGEQSVAAE